MNVKRDEIVLMGRTLGAVVVLRERPIGKLCRG